MLPQLAQSCAIITINSQPHLLFGRVLKTLIIQKAVPCVALHTTTVNVALQSHQIYKSQEIRKLKENIFS